MINEELRFLFFIFLINDMLFKKKYKNLIRIKVELGLGQACICHSCDVNNTPDCVIKYYEDCVKIFKLHKCNNNTEHIYVIKKKTN